MTQHVFELPFLRRIEVIDKPGKVVFRVVAPRTETEVMRIEWSPAEADEIARFIWGASSQASSKLAAQEAEVA